MKRKIKIILKTAQKAVLKATHITRDNFYKGKNFPQTLLAAAKYPVKHGLQATLAKVKREMIRISGNGIAKHHFPNGVVSGVNPAAVKAWHIDKRVSIVIPSYNDYELLKVCVKSIHTT